MQARFPILAAAIALANPGLGQKANLFQGRWDLTITTAQGSYPDWMEVNGSDVLIQPRSAGTVHPSDVKVDGSHLTLAVRRGTTWDLTAAGDRITGTQTAGANKAQIAGVHAPALNRPMPKAWSNPEPIFNGKDLAGWEPIPGNLPSHWVVKNGELVNEQHGANIRTTRKFEDFKLHIEYNCPDKGNSGIYLRGRYEVQVEYEPAGANDKYHSMGSIYSFIAPAVELPKKPGQWETYDITLVGRRLTVVRDGVKTIDNQEIPGITGGALDSNEGEPGPFYIQGDHTGGLRYRDITVQLPK